MSFRSILRTIVTESGGGIGAALMGADVLAVDVDPAAIEATRANADRNGVADRLDTRLGSAGLVAPGTALVIVNVTIDIHETVAAHLNAQRRVPHLLEQAVAHRQPRRLVVAHAWNVHVRAHNALRRRLLL